MNLINNGLNYINFLGHGGGAVWGDRSLMTLEDVPLLSNTHKEPIVTSMTCFTGDVTNPNSLSRRMLVFPNGGALAWFGSAGVGWIINDFLLLEPIHRHLFSDESWTLGELINQGKIEDLATNTGYPNIAKTQVYQFNLSGDPALPFRKPEKRDFSVSPIPASAGHPLTISGLPAATDSFSIHLYDASNIPVGHSSQDPLNLPDDLPAGLYRINASWKNGSGMEHGSQLFSVSGSLVYVDHFLPEAPTAADSVYIWVAAQDSAGIDSVFLRVNNIFHALKTTTEQNVYELVQTLPPFPFGSNIFIEPGAINGNGQVTWGPTESITVMATMNPHLTGLSIFADNDIGLEAAVSNTGTGTGTVEVLFRKQSDASWENLGNAKGTIAGDYERQIRLVIPLVRGENHYQVIMTGGSGYTADTLGADLEPSAFWITPELGSTEDGQSHSIVGIQNVDADVLPGAVSQPEILHFHELNSEDLPHQGGITAVQIDSLRIGVGWTVSANTPILISWSATIPDSLTPVLFAYDENSKVWEQMAGKSNPIGVTGPGMLAYFNVTDQNPPELEVSLNGQRFLHESFISGSPQLSLIARDDHGMDFRSEEIRLCINDDWDHPLEPDKISGSGTTAAYLFSPDLQSVDTLIQVCAADAVGNLSDTLALKFQVKSHLEMLDYGNYPNPFKDQTRFAYELTENVDQFSLDIYTVAGRRVRHFGPQSTVTDLDSRTGAYHEIVWDGRDDGGRFVSNGVYFYRLQVKKGQEVLTHKGKVAKAR